MYVRRKTDQTYNTMLKFIAEPRENFRDKELFLRFWKCLLAYTDGRSYVEMMRMFFGTKCEGTVKSYTRISNGNLNV